MNTAAELVKQARRTAGYSQAELASRTGVAQPTISAYERGEHEPSLSTLQRLVAGAGLRLELVLRPSVTPRLPKTPMGTLLQERCQELIEAGARRGASNIRVFGSVARGDDSPSSDVDLLVDLEPTVGLVGLGELEDALSSILHREVDVVPASALKASLRGEVLAEAIPLEPS